MKNHKLQIGQAAILIVFVLGMISLLIGISLSKTGFLSSIMGRTTAASTQAFYAANSGIEDALLRSSMDKSLGVSAPFPYSINIGDINTDVTITGTEDEKTIESIGTYQNYIRRIRVKAKNTSTIPGFIDAIYAGDGGLIMDNQVVVKGKDGAPGNVYCKSYIIGKDRKNTESGCQNDASAIYGSAWAAGSLDEEVGKIDTVCITASASAALFKNCYVHGPQYSLGYSSCDGGMSEHIDSIPKRDPPNLGEDQIIEYFNSHPELEIDGPCELTGSGKLGDCLGGTDSLGNVKIKGDLEINPSPGVTIKFTGPIWVTGNLEIKQTPGHDSIITPLSTTLSQITVVSGTIVSDSNVTFMKNGKAFLLFVSKFSPDVLPTDPLFCEKPAITLSSNNESVLFYSAEGCIRVNVGTPTGGFKGALLGIAIDIKNNTIIEYDPELQSAIFGLTNTGGWQIEEFKEY